MKNPFDFIGSIGRVMGIPSPLSLVTDGPVVTVTIISNSINPSTQAWVRVSLSKAPTGGTVRVRDLGESATWSSAVAWNASNNTLSAALDTLSTRWEGVNDPTGTPYTWNFQNFQAVVTNFTPQIELDISSLVF